MDKLSSMSKQQLDEVKIILTDIDDTLTTNGRLKSDVYIALEKLSNSGYIIIPVTGRCAGWCDHIARMWPVNGVVGENGAFFFSYNHQSKKMQQPYFFSNYRRQVDEALEKLISQHSDDSKLRAAMRYSSLLGGKRLRPILLLASARALGDVDTRALLTCAVSIECIHAYSLVHDDLPAMDNDALRRGQPTCHIAYNEATAILVGDALQSLAFELLSAESLALSAETKLRLINILSKASGAAGMVLGQAIDLESENKQLSLASLENMHRKKTGALIEASVIMGVTAGFNADKHKQLTQQEHQALINYARCIGLAFQVQDDILDIVSDTKTLGKPQGSDEAKNKSTYPALLGLKGASEKLQTLHDEALASLQVLASRNISQLEQICRFIVSRNQ